MHVLKSRSADECYHIFLNAFATYITDRPILDATSGFRRGAARGIDAIHSSVAQRLFDAGNDDARVYQGRLFSPLYTHDDVQARGWAEQNFSIQ